MTWMLQRVVSLCKHWIHFKEPRPQTRTSAKTSINKRKTETVFPNPGSQSPTPDHDRPIQLEWVRRVRVPSPYFHNIKISRFKCLICCQFINELHKQFPEKQDQFTEHQSPPEPSPSQLLQVHLHLSMTLKPIWLSSIIKPILPRLPITPESSELCIDQFQREVTTTATRNRAGDQHSWRKLWIE